MARKKQTGQPETEFVSDYHWLLAPGDRVQPDGYPTPTRFKTWHGARAIELDGNDPTKALAERQKAYGQWIAQLLDVQLGTKLASLYQEPPPPDPSGGSTPDPRSAWPFTLRDDVIEELGKYFARYDGSTPSLE